MFLVIDLGNTNKKLAVFEKGRLKDFAILPDFNLQTLK